MHTIKEERSHINSFHPQSTSLEKGLWMEFRKFEGGSEGRHGGWKGNR